ncbi:MAG: hypothetical protein H3C31_11695 [Brumimicrobium sp.]|nr:hypothetical protein [Brumimicrobium sp.]MCO5268677.1 hypothetical protein [Brumimicrobium sp.]
MRIHIILIVVFLGLIPVAKSQRIIEAYIDAGGLVSVMPFKEFKNFADSYNTQNSPSKPLKYNPIGFGGEVSAGLNVWFLYTNFGFSYAKSMLSYADNVDNSRYFNFSTYNTNLIIGGKAGKEKFYVAFYAGMSINNQRINSYLQYANGEKSYGSDSKYSGIYSTYRFAGVFGLKLSITFNDIIGMYFDARAYPSFSNLVKGKRGYQKYPTDSMNNLSSFPADANTTGYIYEGMDLKETYNQFTFGLGLTFYIFRSE